jgi:foldase protein PrsA
VSNLSACGGGTANVVVARVGDVAITKASLDHRMSIMARERAAPGRSLRQRALDSLISSRWLIGEAADEGLKVSDQEVKQRLQQMSESSPNGEAGVLNTLKESGGTASDVKSDIEVKLVLSKLSQKLLERDPPVAKTQIARYYRQHMRRFIMPVLRVFDVIEGLKSVPEARKLKREIELGKSYKNLALQESIGPPNPASSDTIALQRAISAAKPHVLTGPVVLYAHVGSVRTTHYALFKINRIIPRTQETLAQASKMIERQLAEEQQQRTLHDFLTAWTQKWTARTDCRPGFVVQKCRQYTEPTTTAPEDPFAAS